MKTLKDFNFKDKRVLVRCDFDVPMDDLGTKVLDDFRLKQALPTIQYLAGQQAKVILMGHAGRPDGKVVETMRLTPVKQYLSSALGFEVKKTSDCIGQEVEEAVQSLKSGEVLMLENLRFYKQENDNDEGFAKSLASLGEIYVNEAFANCHRNHASVSALARMLPNCAGLSLEKEIKSLERITQNPEKPLVAIIGGIKLETKTELVNKISEKADTVFISGPIQKDALQKKIVFKYPSKIKAPIDEVGGGKDIGPRTVKMMKEKIACAKTIFWNGAFGKTEEEEFRKGTKEFALAIVASQAFSVVGGGDTVDFIADLGLLSKFSHVSGGGGAMLTFIAGEPLPGIEALK
jgi:phosphoglycerate kinase